MNASLLRAERLAAARAMKRFGAGREGSRPSFVNDAPWRIHVEPEHADWDSPHHRDAM